MMPFELKLAWTYFRAKRKSLARFTEIAAVVGICVGVASLIVAQSLARGFQDEMRDKILANTAHVSVFLKDGSELLNWREISENLKQNENVIEVEPTTFENAILNSANSSSYAVIKVEKTDNSNELSTQHSALGTIKVGTELAEKSNLRIGDEVDLITFEDETTPKISRVLIEDIFKTGLYEYDSIWINISPENFVKISGAGVYTPKNLSVSVKDIYKANETAAKIRAELGENFRVLDWQEANQPLFSALSLERKVSLAIISLIIFIAVLNITTTLALLVNERKLDIAVLRTCGAKTRSLIFVFLFEGLLLGFFGIFSGVLLGLLACFLGNYFRVINLQAEVYSLNYIPFHADFWNVLLTVLIAFALCLAATIYPAFRASRIKPLENLRF